MKHRWDVAEVDGKYYLVFFGTKPLTADAAPEQIRDFYENRVILQDKRSRVMHIASMHNYHVDKLHKRIKQLESKVKRKGTE